MTCQFLDTVFQFANVNVAPDGAAFERARAHLAGCARCEELYHLDFQLWSNLRQAPHAVSTRKITIFKGRSMILRAAAALVLAAGGIVVSFSFMAPSAVNGIAQTSESVTIYCNYSIARISLGRGAPAPVVETRVYPETYSIIVR
ncbi:MAG: hypothetical protein ACKVS6_07500 [Planctomycetota bacterium]